MANAHTEHRNCPFWKAFRVQRNNARSRHIDFLFDFETWKTWWLQEDRWSNRGLHRGGLVMARFGDAGPYSPENVYCATVRENMQDITVAVRTESKRKQSSTIKADPNWHLRQRGSGHPRSREVLTPAGTFGSAALAAEHFNISRQSAAERARKQLHGWRYT